MSAAIQLSNAAVSMAGGQHVSQAPSDVGRAEDVYAAWKAAFDAARATEPTRDGAHSFESNPDQPDREPRVRQDAQILQQSASNDAAAPSSCDTLTNEAVRIGRAEASSQSSVGTPSRSHAQSAASAASVALPLLQSTTIHKAAAGRSVSPSSPSTPADALPESAAQPAPAEWVQVLVRGAAVAIVVRDTSLTAQEALHCAYQTARELTGRSDALSHVTLNGRTIYQQRPSDSPQLAPAAEQGTTVIEFAC